MCNIVRYSCLNNKHCTHFTTLEDHIERGAILISMTAQAGEWREHATLELLLLDVPTPIRAHWHALEIRYEVFINSWYQDMRKKQTIHGIRLREETGKETVVVEMLSRMRSWPNILSDWGPSTMVPIHICISSPCVIFADDTNTR